MVNYLKYDNELIIEYNIILWVSLYGSCLTSLFMSVTPLASTVVDQKLDIVHTKINPQIHIYKKCC